MDGLDVDCEDVIAVLAAQVADQAAEIAKLRALNTKLLEIVGSVPAELTQGVPVSPIDEE